MLRKTKWDGMKNYLAVSRFGFVSWSCFMTVMWSPVLVLWSFHAFPCLMFHVLIGWLSWLCSHLSHLSHSLVYLSPHVCLVPCQVLFPCNYCGRVHIYDLSSLHGMNSRLNDKTRADLCQGGHMSCHHSM